MKRLAFLLAAVVLFTPACDDDPVTPSNLPLTFTADLRAANEVPPVMNAESGGSGTMALTIEVTRDAAGAITAVNSSTFVVNLAGFPANTAVIAAHIHPGAAGVNGAFLINLNLAAGEVTLAANGSGSFTKSPQAPITVEQAQNLANTPQNFYFNVHTPLNPGGAARAQLVRTQ
jgi:CHRD domain